MKMENIIERYETLAFAPSGTYIAFEAADRESSGPFFGPFADATAAVSHLTKNYSDDVQADIISHRHTGKYHPYVMTVDKRDGTPVIVRDGDSFAFANGHGITATEAEAAIQHNTGGEPLKAAVARGLVGESWPYRLRDETEAEMRARLGE